MNEPNENAKPDNRKRNRMLLLVTLGILVIGIGYGIYWRTVLRLR